MNDDTHAPAPVRTPADAVTCAGCNRIMWKEDVDADGRCPDCPVVHLSPSESHAEMLNAPAATTARKARA